MAGRDADDGSASARRLRANRANARLSTGPRSRDGKARASRNALRHGLSLGSGALPELAPEIARLAAELAGPGAQQAQLERARAVAEAQFDLVRIRRLRHSLIDAVLAELARADAQQQVAEQRVAEPAHPRTPGPGKEPFLVALRRKLGTEPPKVPFVTMLQQARASLPQTIDRDFKLSERESGRMSPTAAPGTQLEQLLREIARLERYERRTFSRRKRALRALRALGPADDGVRARL